MGGDSKQAGGETAGVGDSKDRGSMTITQGDKDDVDGSAPTDF